ncbi:hypothetical protein EI94DRAFT_1703542 [Lactarius quietus]|nr:hypothetical protein EI94DRAFT_1703542 [Lactarius quietus]
MPPKSQQPRDKDGKFLPKNRQSSSSPATVTAPASSSKRVICEGSPNHSTSCACNTSCSCSKRPAQPPLNSSSENPPGSVLKQVEDSLCAQNESTTSTTIPEQSQSNEKSSSPSKDQENSDLLFDSELETDQPENTLDSTFSRIRTIYNMCQDEADALLAMHQRQSQASYSTLQNFPPPYIHSHVPPPSTFPRLAAMPSARSKHAPRVSNASDELLSEFLQEYEDLADGNGLPEKLKVETITHYVPRDLRKLWVTLPELYPDAAEHTCTCQELSQFTELSAEVRIRDNKDVMKYYRDFLMIATDLVDSGDLHPNDYNTEFFRGFHREDRNIIAEEILFNVNPRHPRTEPFNV